jgi:hypothetical protein
MTKATPATTTIVFNFGFVVVEKHFTLPWNLFCNSTWIFEEDFFLYFQVNKYTRCPITNGTALNLVNNTKEVNNTLA